MDNQHLQAVDLARRTFFVDGALPNDLVPAHIVDSWQRCRGLGLDSGLNPSFEPIPESEIRGLLDRDYRLANAAQQELRTLSQATADTGHVVALVDDQGFIIAAGGDLASSGPVLSHTRPGVDIRENNFGTTAPGAALVERRPVFVRRGEHFLSNLRVMECLAAPIFLPNGDLIGVLDVSSDTRPLLPGLMDLVYNSVMRIERQLLRDLRSPAILRLHPHPEGIGTSLEGLIALGDDGEVLGLNSLGARVLGVSQADAAGRLLADLIEGDPRRSAARGGRLLSLRAKGGMNMYATFAEAADLKTRHRRSSASSPILPPARATLLDPLTEHEIKVLRQLDSGLGNREIADSLFVSENTVKFHLKNIYSKLAVNSRLQAIAAARQLGLIH
jgi:transcriptional regulator of acetoin/glycerol metabolism